MVKLLLVFFISLKTMFIQLTKQIIIFISAATLLASCASLYNTPVAPTPYVEKEDGIALSGGLGTNISGNFIAVGATKAMTKDICINASTSFNFMGNYITEGNPYKNSKKQSNLALNIGYNTRSITVYPVQLWFGMQFGNSADSYLLARYEKSMSKNNTINPLDSFTRFESTKGSFIATRLGLTMPLFNNYGGEIKRKLNKKYLIECIGTANFTPISYTVKEPLFTNKYSTVLLGYNVMLRYKKNRRILALNLDNNASIYGLTNEIMRNNTPKPEMAYVPYIIPSLSYTYLFK